MSFEGKNEEMGLNEKISEMVKEIQNRDIKQAELLGLLGQPDITSSTLSTAWSEYQITESNFTKLVNAEIQVRMQKEKSI